MSRGINARAAVTAASSLVPWMAPELTAINRLPMRATLRSYPCAAAALAAAPTPRVESLDGAWRFCLLPRVEDTPTDFASPALDDTAWASIQVPGNWTMQGHGQPQYTNWKMPFSDLPPTVPEANPTGLYRRSFDLPAGWAGLRVVLQIGGAESVHGVWLNGVAVGLGKDSRLPSDYDLTAYLRPGVNTLAIQCIQWSDASFIEDQDQWWHGGLHRSVLLLATPPTWIEDVFAKAGFDATTGAGSLELSVRAGGIPATGWTVAAQVHAADGRGLLAEPLAVPVPHGLRGHKRDIEHLATASAKVPALVPWSAEHPVLHRLVVELRDPAGQVVDATAVDIGFRDVRIVSRDLLINGQRVLIKGVNRHDHHPRTGKHVDEAAMLADLREMKKLHINAVRTSHYPNDPRWLDLCDRHGMYVIDEADVECHDYYMQCSNDPRYAAAFLDRAMRMVLRDRNHPCIIMWSLGNESGYGPHHDAMAAWLRHADGGRPIHYEGAICRANSEWDRGHAATDVVNPMYPSIADIVSWATSERGQRDGRPLILCEFSHAMGNSNGSLKDYWDAITATPGLQGGFIWEWIDHALSKKDADGREFPAYGGDYGEVIHDGNFVCDGLVSADRVPHPGCREVAAVYAPWRIAWASPAARTVRISNGWHFTDSSAVQGSWELLVDGVVQASGALELPAIPALGAVVVAVACPQPRLGPQQEARLAIRLVDRRDMPLVGRGLVVGEADLYLPAEPNLPAIIVPRRHGGALAVSDQSGVLRVGNDRMQFEYARAGGRWRWTVVGRTLVTGGPRLCLWRAPTDNDGIRHQLGPRPRDQWRKPANRWLGLGLHEMQHAVQELSAVADGDGVLLRSVMEASCVGGIARDTAEIRLGRDGRISCQHRLLLPEELADPARLGVHLEAADTLEQLAWYGHGPEESYTDRHAGTPLRRHVGTVRGQYVDYVMPQEHGNKHGVRWLALRDEAGNGFVVSAAAPIDANASRYGAEQLYRGRHVTDLAPEPRVHLHLDLAQRGLGTASCGPDTLPQYRIPAGEQVLAYRLLPLAHGDDPGLLHRAE